MIKKLPNGSLPPFCYIRRKLKRKLNEPWIKAIPTKFLVFNATHPQYAPTALVAIMPPSPEYTCTNPNSTDEMSNAALQPFHLKKENKISPLNKISCPNPLNAKLYKLRSAATRRVMSGESASSPNTNLLKNALTTIIPEYPKLGKNPLRVNPISASDLLRYLVSTIEHTM